MKSDRRQDERRQDPDRQLPGRRSSRWNKCLGTFADCRWYVLDGLLCEECWEEYLSDPDAFK